MRNVLNIHLEANIPVEAIQNEADPGPYINTFWKYIKNSLIWYKRNYLWSRNRFAGIRARLLILKWMHANWDELSQHDGRFENAEQRAFFGEVFQQSCLKAHDELKPLHDT